MAARVVVVHDDRAFLDALTAALRDAGYEVEGLRDPASKAALPPRAADKLEISVSRSRGAFPGLRIMVTGFAAGQTYSGPLAQLLAEPIEVLDVLKALSFFTSG